MKTTKKETAKNESIEENADELTDLSVSEKQADETKGGNLLPAVQKVREAASR